MKKRDFLRLMRRRWYNWRQAVYNTTSTDWHYAGARGAQIGFDTFEEMLDYVETHLGRPRGNKTRLCRINTDGDFGPGNLFWANQRIHNNINHSSHQLEFNGQRHSMREWSRRLKISYNTIKWRLDAGWPVERVLGERPRR